MADEKTDEEKAAEEAANNPPPQLVTLVKGILAAEKEAAKEAEKENKAPWWKGLLRDND